MKKILITGINGFIGQNLRKVLSAVYDVYGLDITKLEEDNKIIEVDITNMSKIEEKLRNSTFDYVIHCAAIAHNDKKQFSEKTLIDVNVNGTRNLLEFFKKKPPKAFIFFSSVAVYGEYGVNSYIDENKNLSPNTIYGKTKVQGEQLCNDSEINTIILRFPVIYSEIMLKDLKKRLIGVEKMGRIFLFKFGNGKQKHVFCHIESVNNIVRFILENYKKLKKNVFQAGDDFYYTSNDLLKYFKSKRNKTISIFLPSWMLKVLLTLMSLMFPEKRFFYQSIYWKLTKNNLYSIEKLKLMKYVSKDQARLL